MFTGGGTGGHVFPGLAVLDRIRELGHGVAWVGGRTGMERDLVLGHGVEYLGIPTGKLRRYVSLRNLADLFRVAGGFFASLGILRSLRPAVVFSKGGFVSVPPVVAAGMLGIPVVSHESDADPGLATRINARFSRAICVAYESVREHFPERLRDRVVVTGNPVRPQILAGDRATGMEYLGFDPGDPRPVVAFLGGSLGARQLNDLVRALERPPAIAWRIVHQTGDDDAGARRTADYHGAPFFRDELPHLLAAADLVVCRAGASTIWESAALAKPMLLVPLVSGSRGDQVRNAAIFERAGAARVYSDPGTLESDIRAALDHLASHPDERREMGARAKSVIRSDAVDRLVELVCGYAEESYAEEE